MIKTSAPPAANTRNGAAPDWRSAPTFLSSPHLVFALIARVRSIPATITFFTGIAVSAFTNLFTSYGFAKGQPLVACAILGWLFASALLYWSWLKSEVAVANAAQRSSRFRHEFRGLRGSLQLYAGIILWIAATWLTSMTVKSEKEHEGASRAPSHEIKAVPPPQDAAATQ